MLVDADACPLPEDPILAEAAAALRDAGHWAEIVDAEWRTVYMTDDLRFGVGFMVDRAPVLLGAHLFGTESLDMRITRWRAGTALVDSARSYLSEFGVWVLADTPGGLPVLREAVDARLRDVVDQLSPSDRTFAASGTYAGYGLGGGRPPMDVTAMRVRDVDGRLAGTVLLQKPRIAMSVLATLGAMGDLAHFERMQTVAAAGRRPAAIMFADLEGSSPLAKRLSTANYFSVGRRMARAADQCIIDAGGITGRHAGDGVVAFFLAENLGSESGAASACIHAARALKEAMAEVAARSDLAPEDLTMRFGLHWGATLYVGQISTAGRTEIAALGDEVNEGARIEACATGGRTLASKHLVERLAPADADALGIDLDRITYVQLGELGTATDKARRDAPSIAVCEL
jgi:class 3 adenylate cyclase